jgi:hypothetical protein
MPTLPSKRKRLAFRLAGFAVGIAVIAVVYQLTRPPDLVWWRSSELPNTGKRARLLIPRGWGSVQPGGVKHWNFEGGRWETICTFNPIDSRPIFLRRLFPHTSDSRRIVVDITSGTTLSSHWEPGILWRDQRDGLFWAERTTNSTVAKILSTVFYVPPSHHEVERFYRRVCNSLKIE